MSKTPKIPLHPKNPERVCWGCDKYCPADSLACGNGTVRTQHPCELFGEDWLEWNSESLDAESKGGEVEAEAAVSETAADRTGD